MTDTKKFLLYLLLLAVVPSSVHAQDNSSEFKVVPEESVTPPMIEPEEFYRGEVIEIIEEHQEDFGLGGTRPFVQTIKVKVLTGPETEQEKTLEYDSLMEEQKVAIGQRVVLLTPNNTTYIFDRYRLPALGGILLLFAALAIAFAGWRGLTSLVGLGVSVLVLALYVVPRIMAGGNPLVASLIGALMITFVSIYLAHGFNQRTTIAVTSTLITVVLAIGLAQLFVQWTSLTGSGSEEAFHLQTSPIAFVNLKGLLLGGIIIGALGVLDDITTAQTAAVYEIWRANPRLSRRELFKRGTSVGKEHITSLVNTLALAYVGASFPALLLFTVYQRPWWVVVNTEMISEEIVRTLVGSIALMAAVPISTSIAVWWLARRQLDASGGHATIKVH